MHLQPRLDVPFRAFGLGIIDGFDDVSKMLQTVREKRSDKDDQEMIEMLDNHMVLKEDKPSLAELNIKLEKAGSAVKHLEEVTMLLEQKASLARVEGFDSKAFDELLLLAMAYLRRSDALLDLAFDQFTTGKLLETEGD